MSVFGTSTALIKELLDQHQVDQIKLRYAEAMIESEQAKARIAQKELADYKK